MTPDFMTTHGRFTDFETVNGSGVTVTQHAGILMRKPGHSGESVTVLKTEAPSAPYTVTANLSVLAPSDGDGGSCVAGVGFRGSDGKLIFVCVNISAANGFKWFVLKQDGPTSSPSAAAGSGGLIASDGLWFRIEDDGEELVFYLGRDGEDWLEVFREDREEYLTPDEIGWMVNGFNNNFETLVKLRHWEIG